MAIALDDFLEIRAAQLAVVHLTRRADIAVSQETSSHDARADLLVSLLNSGREVGQLLAVEVKAVPWDREAADASHQFSQHSHRVSRFPFPMVLFVFSMETDQGFWRWIRQPGADSEDAHRLLTVTDETLIVLTDASMDRMLDSVREWYSQRNA